MTMPLWNAVVLAGDRGLYDPVAKSANVFGKAAVEFQDQSLLERTISALANANRIDQIFVVGPSSECLQHHKYLSAFLENCNVVHLHPENGPSASALKGIIASNYYPTLLVTCDLPLLNSRHIEDYCRKVQNIEADFVVTAVDYERIGGCLPELHKTKYQFGSVQVCFANVFAVLSEPGLNAIRYWQDIERSRKKPIELIRKLDWMSVLRYKFKLLTLEQTANSLSQKVDARIKIKKCNLPYLALDVDSEHDYEVFTKYFNGIN